MTDDIVARLRTWAPLVSTGHEVPAAGQVMFTAADEIERLRAALREIVKECRNDPIVLDRMIDRIEVTARAALAGEKKDD